jgi:hypothetical protein
MIPEVIANPTKILKAESNAKGRGVKFIKQYEDGDLYSVFIFIDLNETEMQNITGYKKKKKVRSTLRGFDAAFQTAPSTTSLTKLPGDDTFFTANIVDIYKIPKKKNNFFEKK